MVVCNFLNLQLVRTPEDIDVTSVEEVRESTMREFEQKQAWVQFIMTLMKRFLAFTFLLVFIGYVTVVSVALVSCSFHAPLDVFIFSVISALLA